MNKKATKLAQLLIVCFVLIMVSGYFAFKSEKKKYPNLTVSQFVGYNPMPSAQSILIGMASNIVFGMIDNGGLWLGMDALDPYLPGGPLSKAAFGNTFSDGLGAFLGTFCGIMIKNKLDPDDKLSPPVWSEAVGIMIGCLIIIPVMTTLTGKN
tara:strand:+ start:1262 stop:1720 length:459 start_codon:yes stop_codon:yes gene_type:complete